VAVSTPATRSGRVRLRAVEAWTGPLWTWAVVATMFLVASLTVANFAQVTNFQAIGAAAVPLAVVAVGETFVVLTGGIDISVAAVISLGNTLSMGLMNGFGNRIWYAVLLSLLVGLAAGAASGLVVALAGVPAFIVTLGAASIVQGIVFAYTHQATYGTPAPSLLTLGYANWGQFPALVVLFVPLLLAALLVQNRTRFGRHLYAIGGDVEVARLAGIRVTRVRVLAFAVSGALAALAGIVISMRLGSGEPLSGTGYDWDAITAVVIGGTALRGGRGGIGGTVAGVLIVATINDLMNLLGVSTFWQTVVKGIVIGSAVIVGAGTERLAQRRRQFSLRGSSAVEEGAQLAG
jgi:ribose/xylose/arabinose/galactoside ABC-type transport system permease subunit